MPTLARTRVREPRPFTFYLLAGLMILFLVFLYGPMAIIYLLSFQGPNGGVTFPMVGYSTKWFGDILRPGQMANIPVSFGRSIALALVVSALTVVISVAAALGFRRRFPGAALVFYIAIASLVMPSLLVGFGIGLGFSLFGLPQGLWTSALGAQLTWTLPFGLLTMFAVVARFNRAYEEAATRPRRHPLATPPLRHPPHPPPRHHRRRRRRIHPLLRRIRPHHADHRQLQHPAARNLRAHFPATARPCCSPSER